MINYDEHLNEEQLNAHNYEGNVLLIACPGSGKTRTLTYRIVKELHKNINNKKHVVAITYTNRAAEEIIERIESLGIITDRLWIGTIHSFCLEWILRPYGIYLDELKYGFSIIPPHESERIIKDLCSSYKEIKLSHFDCGYYINCEKIIVNHYDLKKREHIHNIISLYHDTLLAQRKVDFEKILHYSYILISKFNGIALNLSKLFSLILVDEYQDTREIQYEILSLIFKAGSGSTNGFFVGDPNQSIYTSLGGYPITLTDLNHASNMEFKQLYLSINHRSFERIIDFYSKFKVFDSKILPHPDKLGGGKVYYSSQTQHTDLAYQFGRILNEMIDVLKIPQNEICIISPQWMPLASITRQLTALFPQYLFDGPGMVPFAKDIENFWYKVSRVILTEPSPELYTRRLRWAKEILDHLQRCNIKMTINNKDLLYMMNSFSIQESSGMSFIKKGFEHFLEKLKIKVSEHDELKLHYDCFFDSSKERIDKMVKDGIENPDDLFFFRKAFKPREGIAVSTIHGVKGAEYECVIAYGLIEGMVPFFADNDPLISAKKSLYVLSSRAKNHLFLFSEKRNGKSPTQVLHQYLFAYDKYCD